MPDTARATSSARLLRWIGPRPLKPALAAMKLRGLSVYDFAPLPGHPMPTSVEQIGVRHRRVSGSNLRAAVFGVNDGLVSNVSLIMGVAGSGVASETHPAGRRRGPARGCVVHGGG